jgi:hypothetical protein
MQHLFLFQFAMSQGPRLFVQYIAVNFMFLLIIQGAGNIFLWLTDAHHV